MKREKPLYAVINCFGDGWTVIYKAYPENLENHASHTGYGSFPDDRFPDIPVIDLTTARTVTGFTNRSVLEAYNDKPNNCVPLARHLTLCESEGATIYYS